MICTRRQYFSSTDYDSCGNPAVAVDLGSEGPRCLDCLEENDTYYPAKPLVTRLLRGIAVLLAYDPYAGWTNAELAEAFGS